MEFYRKDNRSYSIRRSNTQLIIISEKIRSCGGSFVNGLSRAIIRQRDLTGHTLLGNMEKLYDYICQNEERQPTLEIKYTTGIGLYNSNNIGICHDMLMRVKHKQLIDTLYFVFKPYEHQSTNIPRQICPKNPKRKNRSNANTKITVVALDLKPKSDYPEEAEAKSGQKFDPADDSGSLGTTASGTTTTTTTTSTSTSTSTSRSPSNSSVTKSIASRPNKNKKSQSDTIIDSDIDNDKAPSPIKQKLTMKTVDKPFDKKSSDIDVRKKPELQRKRRIEQNSH